MITVELQKSLLSRSHTADDKPCTKFTKATHTMDENATEILNSIRTLDMAKPRQARKQSPPLTKHETTRSNELPKRYPGEPAMKHQCQ